MTTPAKKETITILLPEGRLINASLFEKDAYTDPKTQQEGKPGYKIELRFDPAQVTGQGTVEDDLINAACDEWGDPAEEQFLDGKIISPLLLGDKLAARREEKGKAGDAYRGGIVIRANTMFNLHGQDAPGGIQVYGPDVKPIGPANQQEVYPGCFGQAAVTIGCYTDNRGDKALKFYLSAFQKTRDGEPLVSARDHSTLFKPAQGSAAPAAAAGGRRATRRS